MTRDGFSTSWTGTGSPAGGAGRASRAGLAALLALASACSARQAAPASVAAPGAGANAGAAPAAALDEAGCLALVVPAPAERDPCEGDARGPCVGQISLEQSQIDPARYLCFALVIGADQEDEDGAEEAPASTEGTYTLAVIEREGGAWVVRGTKQLRYWRQDVDAVDASIVLERVGPGQEAVVVSERTSIGARETTEEAFHLVTSSGLTEVLWFSSEVSVAGMRSHSYRIDDQATTGGYHDIVLSVETASFAGQSEEDGSHEERYRWNGTQYQPVAGQGE
jgi:hypothetical protein